MLVSWNWLKEYVRLDMPLETLVERLMMSGLNHEGTEEIEGDFAIDLEVTSNRPDCLGHIGIAREVAALLGHELKLPATEFGQNDHAIKDLTSVEVAAEAAKWCPQYRARLIEGIRIGPSPEWMQRRLRSVGLLPINNVVDVTNYVLLECGQPLHAFDFENLRENRIVVRNARPNEKFLAIDNREYELQPWMGVIADAERTVALAGVMGGAESEISPNTKTVLLESAEFFPSKIRRGSRALDLSSESSYRFERKVDPAGIAWASDRACHLLCELAGGTVAAGYIHVGETDYSRQPITLRWSRVGRILGIEVPREETKKILVDLGLQPPASSLQSPSEGITVIPPTFRRDLTREIDLIEEIGRIYGYESIPEDRNIPLAVSPKSKQDSVQGILRDCLRGLGYCEAITFSFTDQQMLTSIRPWTDAGALAVSHSSRKQENLLRQSLLPSLLGALRLNDSRGNTHIDLFEISQVFLPDIKKILPEEPIVVGLAGMQDFRTVRGHIESIFDRLRIAPELSPAEIEGLDPERSAELRLDGQRIGVIGYVSEKTENSFDLRREVVVAELSMAPLVDRAQTIARAQPLPDQPSMVRDLNFVLGESVRWSELEILAISSAGSELEDLEFVDLYRGKQVPISKKSITIRLTYRAAGRTLTSEEVDGYQQNVIDAVRTNLGGELR